MSFLDAQDLASVAASSDFLALLLAAWADLSDSQAFFNALDLGLVGALAAFMLRRRRR